MGSRLPTPLPGRPARPPGPGTPSAFPRGQEDLPLGELIDLLPYLERRRPAAPVLAGPPPDDDLDHEIVLDLLDELEATRDEGVCESCRRRPAVAEVHRSDAIDAGLGGMLQCRRCLASELSHNRCGPEARRAEWAVAAVLREADQVVRIDIAWDTGRERALSVDGIRLA